METLFEIFINVRMTWPFHLTSWQKKKKKIKPHAMFLRFHHVKSFQEYDSFFSKVEVSSSQFLAGLKPRHYPQFYVKVILELTSW